MAAGERRGIRVQHHRVPRERERESGDPSQTPLMVQKDSLTSYAMPFVFRLTAQAVNWEAFLCSLMSLPSSRALRSFSCPGPSTSRRWWEIPELHWHRQLNLALLVVMEKGLPHSPTPASQQGGFSSSSWGLANSAKYKVCY